MLGQIAGSSAEANDTKGVSKLCDVDYNCRTLRWYGTVGGVPFFTTDGWKSRFGHIFSFENGRWVESSWEDVRQQEHKLGIYA